MVCSLITDLRLLSSQQALCVPLKHSLHKAGIQFGLRNREFAASPAGLFQWLVTLTLRNVLLISHLASRYGNVCQNSSADFNLLLLMRGEPGLRSVCSWSWLGEPISAAGLSAWCQLFQPANWGCSLMSHYFLLLVPLSEHLFTESALTRLFYPLLFPPFSPSGEMLQSTVPFPRAGQEFILPIHELFWLFETHMCVCTQNHEQTHSESVSEIPAESCQLSHTDVSSLLVF